MTTENRLAKSETASKRTPQEWCDRGNALLAGTEATTKGEYLPPRHDVHWFVENGRPTIGWKHSARHDHPQSSGFRV